MPTPENTLWDKAGLAVTNGPEGRFAITVAGSTLELGDSGLRDLTGLLQNTTSGTLKAHRANGTTTIVANALVKSATSVGNTNIIAGNGPMGAFGGATTFWTERDVNGSRLGISAAGAVYLDSTSPAFPYYATLTFPSVRGWWTALNPRPGVPDGQPVGG